MLLLIMYGVNIDTMFCISCTNGVNFKVGEVEISETSVQNLQKLHQSSNVARHIERRNNFEKLAKEREKVKEQYTKYRKNIQYIEYIHQAAIYV